MVTVLSVSASSILTRCDTSFMWTRWWSCGRDSSNANWKGLWTMSVRLWEESCMALETHFLIEIWLEEAEDSKKSEAQAPFIIMILRNYGSNSHLIPKHIFNRIFCLFVIAFYKIYISCFPYKVCKFYFSQFSYGFFLFLSKPKNSKFKGLKRWLIG